MKDVFTTNKGQLSSYAFACGYKERIFYYKGRSILNLSLFMESAHYHVRGFYCGAHIFECFDTLTEARAFTIEKKAIARMNARLESRG